MYYISWYSLRFLEKIKIISTSLKFLLHFIFLILFSAIVIRFYIHTLYCNIEYISHTDEIRLEEK